MKSTAYSGNLSMRASLRKNSLVEQFNRTFRRDGIDSYMFDSLPDIIRYADAWAWMYNNERPILPGGN